MAHSSNTALEIVDSPGSNEALSPHLNEKWAVAIAHSDIVIVVVAYSQLETKDVAAFWTRYARELPSQASSRNLLVFVNKYDQADSSHAFTEEDEEIDHIRRRCVQCVEDATEGKVNLLVDQVFLGSARDALLSQIATGINDENPNEDFQQEYSEVSALASRVFGRRREPPPASAGALKDLVNWCDVRNDSRIDAFVSCFGAKARSAEVTHVYKLIAAVDAAVLEIRSAYTSRGGYFQQEITKRGAEEKELCLMEKTVENYFTSDIEPEDTVAEDESRRLLAEWISETNDAIMDALDSQPSQMPLSLSVTDEELLIHTLERFEQSAREAVRLSAESYKPSIAGMTEARWLGVRACDDDVQRLLAGIRGSLSEEVVGSSHAVRVPTIDATLEQLSDWMLYAVRVDVEDATAQLMLTARTESDPGAVYRSEIDFARPVNRRRLHGDFYHDSDSGHIKLGPAANPFTATFQVDERFESHPFVLELSHLASDGGPSSRAPVTVLLNDHVIRENFCPRAENGSENDHIGLWDYAFNSWHLDSLIVQRGENRVQIRYCEGGTTFYWLRSICLHCEVPPTSTTVIDTRTIKDFVQTSILSRLQEGLDSGDGVLTRAQHELSSPRSVLQAIRSHYNRVFVALKEVKVQDQVKFEYQQRAVATVLSYCEELASSCQTLANEVGAATPPAEA
ncbi:uncharacterized protein IUM83_13812 [Phytophthora cinnamomi]|uniref:uncharacterized protein n=1 Tax=Phytophthora cinnamomi TaxID=4785 RepID=UPI00355A682B|nr:hypothetical protein IUM83_13812 [Phytophthora cinnamomi]